MRWSTLRRATAVCACLTVLAAAATAFAQAPPYPPPPAAAPGPLPAGPQASEIASCLCLQQDVNALSADLTARQRSYESVRDQLARLDGQLQRERAGVDVNNPAAVAQFRQLLERRDAVFRRQSGPEFSGLSAVTAHYNARVNEYNARCANQPRNAELLAQVQATLSCPAPR